MLLLCSLINYNRYISDLCYQYINIKYYNAQYQYFNPDGIVAELHIAPYSENLYVSLHPFWLTLTLN